MTSSVVRALAVALGLFALAGCVSKESPAEARFRAAGFDRLAGWQEDMQGEALAAFLRSCAKLVRMEETKPIGPYGTAGDWRAPCTEAAGLAPGAARQFFESRFVPFQVFAGRDADGLFTGYYEPELRGSRIKSGRYAVPLLARPADLVSVDLGEFRPALKGQRIAGRLSEGRLKPYAERRVIEAEAPSPPLRTPLVWVDDPVDAFFMEIQGSGRIRFEDGSAIRLGYDGQNGHPYTPIGRLLRERGALPRENISMQSIRAWLAQNPEAGAALMDENASYVFFKEKPVENPALGPPGAQGVVLTPGRSLAVDLAQHGLGVPVFVAADPPAPGMPPFRRLMIAQDTGGAIIGPVRGDVFWGFGTEAGEVAGVMKSEGRMFVLVPRVIAAQFAERR